ncbi:hypothetical protein LG272_01220 [Pseudidiomarina marina]|uniref:hypothetical protein n=1 Tax=Pseudidiomarina marina TaxID=502366 RepID=UPI00384F4594
MKTAEIKLDGDIAMLSSHSFSSSLSAIDKRRYLSSVSLTEKADDSVNSNDEREKMFSELLPQAKYLMDGQRMRVPTHGRNIIDYIRFMYIKGYLTLLDVSRTPFGCILDFYLIEHPETTTAERGWFTKDVLYGLSQHIPSVECTVRVEDNRCALILDNYFAITIG